MAKKQNIRYGQAAVEADVCAGLDEADEDVRSRMVLTVHIEI